MLGLSSVQLLIYLLPFIQSYYIKSLSGKRDHIQQVWASKVTSTLLPEALTSRIASYLEVRQGDFIPIKDDNFRLELNYTKAFEKCNLTELLQPEEKAKDDNFFQMFKPSGYYRDKSKDLASSLLQSRFRILPHPFSMKELATYGYEDLASFIVMNGGPIAVGEIMGLKWNQTEAYLPATTTLTDLELKNKAIQKQSGLDVDIKGSLRLGAALEERLGEAEELNLQEIRQFLAKKQQDEAFAAMLRQVAEGSNNATASSSSSASPYSMDYTSYAYQELQRQYSSSLSPLSPNRQRKENDEEKLAKIKLIALNNRRNKFQLTTMERIHCSALLLSLCVGFGRTSQEIMSQLSWGESSSTIIDIIKIVSLLLAGTSVLSAGYNMKLLKEKEIKEINSIVWLFRGVLGGPQSGLILQKVE